MVECQEKIKSFILYNIQGQIVKSFSRIDSKQFTINETMIEKGVYFVHISAQNETIIKQIVITE